MHNDDKESKNSPRNYLKQLGNLNYKETQETRFQKGELFVIRQCHTVDVMSRLSSLII